MKWDERSGYFSTAVFGACNVQSTRGCCMHRRRLSKKGRSARLVPDHESLIPPPHHIRTFEFRCLSISGRRCRMPRAAAVATARSSRWPSPAGPCGRGTERRTSGVSKRGGRARRSSDLSSSSDIQTDPRPNQATLEKESFEHASPRL